MFGKRLHNDDRSRQSERHRAYVGECVFPKKNSGFVIWKIHKYEQHDNRTSLFTFFEISKVETSL